MTVEEVIEYCAEYDISLAELREMAERRLFGLETRTSIHKLLQ